MENELELVITRIFDAPREVVFKFWTDASLTKQWMGPRDYPAVYVEQDLRPGGIWRVCLRSTESNKELWQRGVYREIKEPESLVFTFVWEGENDLPHQENLVSINFTEFEGKTKMIFRQAVFDEVVHRDGHSYGWNSSFDRLIEFLGHTSEDSIH